ncbi:chemotaxis protein CheA [Pseudomonas sp. C2B4]|uniref:chemotaxis protein CheA n=1 Tax=Pseudomonas sp. C2B4 TaxID=2735270 RepID=UPI001586B270|nr:chemotaxis protein CheA [Pseudomonas sp. C2B4]NUU37767.1 chemotaxis protein CheA [Pseudomonas sp. C2B4]
MNLDSARGALVQEGRELLATMEEALLAIEEQGFSEERINAIFRAAHTIKGSAGLFGLESLVSFTHVAESLLDQVRTGELFVEGAMLSLLLTCGDYIGSLLTAVEEGSEMHEPNAVLRAHLLVQLQEYLDRTHSDPGPEVEAAEAGEPQAQEPGDSVDNAFWHISLRLSADVLRNGMDPLSFLRYLGKLGRIVQLHTVTDQLPIGERFDAESCYLGFELEFDSAASKQDIESVFEFVRDDCQLSILPPYSQVEEYLRLIKALPESPQRLGEILLQCGALTPAELDRVLERQRLESAPVPLLGSLLLDDHLVPQPVMTAALNKQKHSEDKRVHEQVFIKVEVGKLDQLINLVGELVIAGAATNLHALRRDMDMLEESAQAMSVLVESIRDASLSLRMVAIGEVFQRFPRVVRDISKELGKDIQLLVTGADTELDKSMVERLADPLMHIVRNAMDHGIETAQERLVNGKVASGSLRLNAYHESGSIVIEVSDDGRGLDRQRILAKALQRGLVQQDQALSDAEVYRLIFEPGFSTAEHVTNLSGRGVGMDVVRRNIEQLRGEVEVLSEFGRGTTVQIRLPLTLAIIDGFQVRVGEEHFVLPLEQVIECVDLPPHEGRHHLIRLRGEPLPFLRLREVFSITGASTGRESLVVLQHGAHRAGLVVDQLVGELQAVIKPLGMLFQKSRGLSGSTILGDGRVALILDVANLLQRANAVSVDTPGRPVEVAPDVNRSVMN